MSWRANLLLAALGLGLSLIIAGFQPFPGYLDSDYYFSGGLQLVHGRGFTEPYLWNYLDDPQALPHPSHSYWMPVSSLIAAAGMWMTRDATYASARLGFLVLAAAVPVVTANLAFAFSKIRDLAMVSGLLAVFSIYYAPFLPVPDNYGVYLVLGSTFLLLIGCRRAVSFFCMGAVAGLMTLARSDGLLWLGLAIVAATFKMRAAAPAPGNEPTARDEFAPGRREIRDFAARVALAAGGFLLVMAPWFLRNYSVYGTFMAPGAQRLLWLTSYGDTFVYPADQLTPSRWLEQGWATIFSARWIAFRWNLLNAFAAQGGIFLAPFILIGAWMHRRDERVRIGVLGWLAILITMTLVFPFAGARGGFFHSGASLQGLWWTLAPLGLEATVAVARRRSMFTPQAFRIFRAAIVGIAALMTAMIFAIRILPGWGEGEGSYADIDAFLRRSGAQTHDIVMVRNPPGYYALTGRSAIVVPYGEPDSILAAAKRYDARYLVIEEAGAAGPIRATYDDLGSPVFEFLGELGGTRIFRIRP